jgi:hypothetical protein
MDLLQSATLVKLEVLVMCKGNIFHKWSSWKQYTKPLVTCPNVKDIQQQRLCLRCNLMQDEYVGYGDIVLEIN